MSLSCPSPRRLVVLGCLLLAPSPLLACGGEDCEVAAGNWSCRFTVQKLSGDCSLTVGQQLSYTLRVTEESDRQCKSESVSDGPTYQAGSDLYMWYDGTMTAVSSVRLEGYANYRMSPSLSGGPECRLSGPLVCTH